MSLHFKLGIVNDLYDILDKILAAHTLRMRADYWAKACYLIRNSHYGAKKQFNGHGCHTLLENIKKLTDLLTHHNLFELCKPVVDCFEAIHCVVKSCFGKTLYERYHDDIKQFARAFFLLKAYCANLSIRIHVTPKIHGTFIHIKQFIDYQKAEKNMEFGLGLHSEQVSPSPPPILKQIYKFLSQF